MVYGLEINEDTLGSGQRRWYGSWDQHMDIATLTTPTTLPPTTPPTIPPTAQNVILNSTIFCNFTVDLRSISRSCEATRLRRVLCHEPST